MERERRRSVSWMMTASMRQGKRFFKEQTFAICSGNISAPFWKLVIGPLVWIIPFSPCLYSYLARVEECATFFNANCSSLFGLLGKTAFSFKAQSNANYKCSYTLSWDPGDVLGKWPIPLASLYCKKSLVYSNLICSWFLRISHIFLLLK